MIIKDIISQLENAKAPVIKILQNQAPAKVLVIGLKKGIALKEHKTAIPARLMVLDGTVAYQQEGISATLNKLSDMEIPVNILHAVEAIEDSVCLLIIG